MMSDEDSDDGEGGRQTIAKEIFTGSDVSREILSIFLYIWEIFIKILTIANRYIFKIHLISQYTYVIYGDRTGAG